MLLKLHMAYLSLWTVILPLSSMCSFAAMKVQQKFHGQSDQSRLMATNRHSDLLDGGCVELMPPKGLQPKTLKNNNIENCKKFCEEQSVLFEKMTHMGLQDDKCFCYIMGPEYDQIRHNSECTYNCPGEPTEQCGGYKRLTVFELNWDGACVSDILWTFKNNIAGKYLINNSPEICKAECSKGKHNTYIALKNDICHCLTIHPPYKSMVWQIHCNEKCSGDTTRRCGSSEPGDEHYNIHKLEPPIEEKEKKDWLKTFLDKFALPTFKSSLQLAWGTAMWAIGWRIQKNHYLPEEETEEILGLCIDATFLDNDPNKIKHDLNKNSKDKCKNYCKPALYAALLDSHCYCKTDAPEETSASATCDTCDADAANPVCVVSPQEKQNNWEIKCVPDSYVDNAEKSENYNENSVQSCKDECGDKKVIGLKETICYCLDDPPSPVNQIMLFKPDQCEKCPAKPEDECGGSNTVSIYRDGFEDKNKVHNTVWDHTNLWAHVLQNTWNWFWNTVVEWAFDGVQLLITGGSRNLALVDDNKLIEDTLQMIETFLIKTNAEGVARLEERLFQVFDQYGK